MTSARYQVPDDKYRVTGTWRAFARYHGRMKKRAIMSVAIGAAAATAAVGAWAWRKYGPGTYKRFKTMFGRARVYQVLDDNDDPVRLLEVGGIVQSGTYLDERYTELVFEYLKRYDILFERNPNTARVLVLGCGGYDYPEHLIANHPDTVVDAVEIDPAITAIARQYFFLDRIIEEFDTERTGRLNLICDDALAYLFKTDKCYDAIVNDTFDAGTPPVHLTTKTFAQAVRDHLNPGGLYLTNIVASLEGTHSQFLKQQTALLESTFEQVDILPCCAEELTEADNVVVVCQA